MNVLELRIRDVGINLCSGNGRVPEHFLDGPNICTILQESSGEAMSQSMSRDILGNSGLESSFANHIGYKESRETHSCIIEIDTINTRSVIIVSNKEGREGIVSNIQIGLDSLPCGIGEINNSYLASFPTYTELLGFEINTIAIKGGEFRNTKPSRINTLEYGEISEFLNLRGFSGLEELYNLIGREKRYLSIAYFCEVDDGRINTGDSLLFEILEKGTERYHIRIRRSHGEATIHERDPELIEIGERYMFDFHESNRSQEHFCLHFEPTHGRILTRTEIDLRMREYFSGFCGRFWVHEFQEFPKVELILLRCFRARTTIDT